MNRVWYGAGRAYAATMQMKIYFIHTKTRNQFYLFIFPFYTIKLGAAAACERCLCGGITHKG